VAMARLALLKPHDALVAITHLGADHLLDR
jgi:hypothetical protein